MACALFFGAAFAQGPGPDANKIRAGAKVVEAGNIRKQAKSAGQEKPPAARDYPLTLSVLDANGVEAKTAKFAATAGDSLPLILRISNRGEAEEFRLGGTAIGVGGNLPGSVRLAPGTQTDVPFKLVKPDWSDRKGRIDLILSPVNSKTRYRSTYNRIVLDCG